MDSASHRNPVQSRVTAEEAHADHMRLAQPENSITGTAHDRGHRSVSTLAPKASCPSPNTCGAL